MDVKHVYWFSYFGKVEPSVRYRMTYPLQHLEKEYNITSSAFYPGAYSLKNFLNFYLLLLSALLFRRKYSVIVFQKIYTNGLYARLLKLLLFFSPRYTLYDIDDAEHTRRSADTIHHFMRRCSACSVGSEALAVYAKPFSPNVFMLTTPVIDHGILKTEREHDLTIGWVGYYTAHRQSLLQLFFPALLSLDIPIHLVLLGVRTQAEVEEITGYFSSKPNITLHLPLNIDWHDEPSIYNQIRRFDIGVSPLIDTEFNRAKSAFKLKQYLSCGVPVLGSSVGENKRFIQPELNGYICDTPEEYREKIMVLHELPKADYEAFMRRAKESFASFSIEKYCKDLLSHYKHAASKNANQL